jgi:hypothetical protein
MTRMSRNQLECLWIGAVAVLFILAVDPMHKNRVPHTMAEIAFVGVAIPLLVYLLWCRWFEKSPGA